MTPQRATAVWVGYVNPARSMARDFHGQPGVRRHLPGRDLPRLHAAGAEGPAGRRLAALAPGVAPEQLHGRHPPRSVRAGADRLQGRARADHGGDDRPCKQTSDCERGLTFVPDMTGLKRSAARALADGQGLDFQWEFRPRSRARRSTAWSTRCRRRASRCRSGPGAGVHREGRAAGARPGRHRARRHRGGGAPAGGEVPRRDRGRRRRRTAPGPAR